MLIGLEASASELNICLQKSLDKLDIQLTNDPVAEEVLHKKVYESLVRQDSESKNYYNLISESITFPKQNSILIKIKNNIQFHSNKYFKPSRKLNADDIVFSLKRLIQNKEKITNFIIQSELKKITNIEKISNDKVLISTNDSINDIYKLLINKSLIIHSYEYYLKLKKNKKLNYFTFYPIGTGPFSYIKKTNSKISLKRNLNYYGIKPKITKLNYKIIHNRKERSLEALKGSCHIAHSPSWEVLDKLKLNDKVKIISSKENNLLSLDFNTQNRFLSNQTLRKIISYALQPETYTKKVFLGHIDYVHTYFPKDLNIPSLGFFPLTPNLEQSKKDLKIKFPYLKEEFTLLVPSKRNFLCESCEEIAKLIQKDLFKIGLKVKLLIKDEKDYQLALKEKNYAMALKVTPDIEETRKYFFPLTCENNKNSWCHKDFETLFTGLIKSSPKDQSLELLKKMIMIENMERPRLKITYLKRYQVINNSILNYKSSFESSSDLSRLIFLNSFLEQVTQK